MVPVTGFDELDGIISLAHRAYRVWKCRRQIVQHRVIAAPTRIVRRGSRAAAQTVIAHYHANKHYWWMGAIYLTWTGSWVIAQGPNSPVNIATYQVLAFLAWASIALLISRWCVRRVRQWL